MSLLDQPPQSIGGTGAAPLDSQGRAPIPEAGSPSKWDYDAVIFDMDGVITDTAAVHSAAWKRTFEDYLRLRESRHGEPFRECPHAEDYLSFVDGMPREHGVMAFVESRGIHLPMGLTEDPASAGTIGGLGNRKNELFREIIETDGVRVYASTMALIGSLRGEGIKVGLATSSKNSAIVLAKSGAGSLFGAIVDGLVSERLKLKGKPNPDIFLTACADLGASPARAIVVEEAGSGVSAGVRGRVGLGLGVAREHNHGALRRHGADLVVGDLAETSVEDINARVRAKRANA